jgi:hypothetical protein
MAAQTTDLEDESSEEPASVRVETFLQCVETTRRRTLHVRLAAAAVGAVVATVVFLTSTGVIAPDVARLAASAGAVVAGLVASGEGHATRASPDPTR